jgi:hypothetical protein
MGGVPRYAGTTTHQIKTDKTLVLAFLTFDTKSMLNNWHELKQH